MAARTTRRHVPKRYPSLRAYRLAANLSQRDAARLFDITHVQWSRLERGLQHPRRELASRLIAVTGVPAAVLFGVSDPTKRHTA